MNELATTGQEIVPASPPEPTAAHMLAAVIERGVTQGDVETVRALCELRREERASEAKEAFFSAFVKLQAATPAILASKVVPGSTEGSVRYIYAPYEDIMRQVSPLLRAHGFGVTFDTEISEGRVIATCTLIHEKGHSRSNKFAARIGSGPPKSSEAQGDGAASTYAKRFALCAALNIVVEQDTDGADDHRNIGTTIDPSEAADMRSKVDELGKKIDGAKFLKWLGVGSYEEIPANRSQAAWEQLKKREASL